ncbi:MAG: CAP domain-containing protein [Saprospiraceae bacterium]
MIKFLFSIILIFISHKLNAQLPSNSINLITQEINDVRSVGLRCGGTYMPPVHKIYWHEKLYNVSLEYATYMRDNDHFAHLSKEGDDAGIRLDKIGYKWKFVGENIAMGQHDFHEVMKDWIKSESHCKMLMSNNMFHFAVARNKEYWVQTFATPMRR